MPSRRAQYARNCYGVPPESAQPRFLPDSALARFSVGAGSIADQHMRLHTAANDSSNAGSKPREPSPWATILFVILFLLFVGSLVLPILFR